MESHLADEPRQVEASSPVAVAPEVDPGQDDLPVTVVDPPPDLGENGFRRAAPGGAAHLRNHAERAREAAAVLHLHERPDPVEADVGPDAADRADVARDELRRPLSGKTDDCDVLGQAGERVAGKVGRTARHVDPLRSSRGAARCLARLAHGLVGDAARVHDGDVRRLARLDVAVGDQALADLLDVRLGDLAPEEVDRERRHAVVDASPGGKRARFAEAGAGPPAPHLGDS